MHGLYSHTGTILMNRHLVMNLKYFNLYLEYEENHSILSNIKELGNNATCSLIKYYGSL